MPYTSIANVPGQIKTHQGAKLTLAQANKWASIFDAIKAQGGVESPAAVAWSSWTKLYRKEGDHWVTIKKNDEGVENFAEVKDMEIFFAGKHKGDNYTNEDVQEVADNFNKFKGKIRPKLKITHGESQKTLAGLASYGDVTSVFTKLKDGVNHLFADFVNVPNEVVAWIKNRRFPERSSEIYSAIPIDGAGQKNVLRNVSLLGHEPPAVKGLELITALSDEGEYKTIVINFNESKPKQKEGGDTDMGNEVLELQITKLKEENEALNKKLAAIDDEAEKKKFQDQIDAKDEEITKLTEANKKIEDLEKEATAGKEATDKLTKLQEQTKKADIDSSIESLKKDGHILPVQEPGLRILMESLDSVEIKKYSLEKGKETEGTMLQLLKDTLKLHKVTDFKEKAPAGDKTQKDFGEDKGKMELPSGEVETAGVAFDKKVKAYQEEHEGVSYKDAMLEVEEQEKENK